MLRTFAFILGSCVVASALHEATHYAAARALGRRAVFVPREWAVYFEPGGARGNLAIQGAPLVIGAVAGSVALWWGGVSIDFLFLPAWYLYTVHGALTNDFGGHVFDLPKTIFSRSRT